MKLVEKLRIIDALEAASWELSKAATAECDKLDGMEGKIELTFQTGKMAGLQAAWKIVQDIADNIHNTLPEEFRNA